EPEPERAPGQGEAEPPRTGPPAAPNTRRAVRGPRVREALRRRLGPAVREATCAGVDGGRRGAGLWRGRAAPRDARGDGQERAQPRTDAPARPACSVDPAALTEANRVPAAPARRSTALDWGKAGLLLAALGIGLYFWHAPALRPLKLLVVMMHETGHALA